MVDRHWMYCIPQTWTWEVYILWIHTTFVHIQLSFEACCLCGYQAKRVVLTFVSAD
jgi:hypothetical protein